MPVPSTPPSKDALAAANEPVPLTFGEPAAVAFTFNFPVESTEKALPNPALESYPPTKAKRDGGADPVTPSKEASVLTVFGTVSEPVTRKAPAESSCKKDEVPAGVTPRAIKPRLPVVVALPLANATC